jgi:hypothetical protein
MFSTENEGIAFGSDHVAFLGMEFDFAVVSLPMPHVRSPKRF